MKADGETSSTNPESEDSPPGKTIAVSVPNPYYEKGRMLVHPAFLIGKCFPLQQPLCRENEAIGGN